MFVKIHGKWAIFQSQGFEFCPKMVISITIWQLCPLHYSVENIYPSIKEKKKPADYEDMWYQGRIFVNWTMCSLYRNVLYISLLYNICLGEKNILAAFPPFLNILPSLFKLGSPYERGKSFLNRF